MKNKMQNIVKNYWVLAVSILLTLIGWGLKEYVAETFYYAYAGTNTHAKFTDLLHFAEVHHEYLPNVHLDKYSSAWCSLVQIISITITYVCMQFNKIGDNKGKWIATVGCAYGCAVVAGIWAITGNSANVIDSMILMIAFTVMYLVNGFNRNTMIFAGLFVGGSLGNFIEGNVRGFVIDYLWFLPEYSTQVHNLEDVMIWIGLFGTIICFGVWLAKVMIAAAVKIRQKNVMRKLMKSSMKTLAN